MESLNPVWKTLNHLTHTEHILCFSNWFSSCNAIFMWLPENICKSNRQKQVKIYKISNQVISLQSMYLLKKKSTRNKHIMYIWNMYCNFLEQKFHQCIKYIPNIHRFSVYSLMKLAKWNQLWSSTEHYQDHRSPHYTSLKHTIACKFDIEFFFSFLLYFTLQYCIGFAIHWHESALDVHELFGN